MCNPNPVWGNNDGLLNGNYQYVFSGGVSSIQISKAACLANDAPNCQMTCIGMVYNYSNVTLSTSGNSITVTLAAGVVSNCGPILIKYIPVNSAGAPGNVTYIYVYLPCGNCNVNPCNLIQNGGLELGVACSTLAGNPPTISGGQASCWQFVCPTPDLFDRFCATPLAIAANGTGIGFGFSDTHNGFPNNRCIGFQATINGNNNSFNVPEVIANHLSTPLVPGGMYQLSAWVFLGNSAQFTPLNTVLTIASSNSLLNCPWTNAINGAYPTSPNSQYITSYIVPSTYGDFKWHYITTTFTFTGNSMHNVLYFAIDPVRTTTANPSINSTAYLVLDDVSLLPQGSQPVFSPPTIICKGQTISNIGQYAIGSGTISGPGIQQSGTIYNLNTTNLQPGIYGYSFAQTNTVTNCTNTVWAQISVINSTPQVVSSLTNNCITSPQSITLTALTSTLLPHSYTWQPSASNNSVIVVTPTVSTVYTLVTTNSVACQNMTTYPVVLLPPINFTNTPLFLCPGDRLVYLENYLATGTPSGGVWTTSSPSLVVQNLSTGYNILTVLSTASPGTYTVNYSYQTSTVCSVSNFFTVNIAATPTVGASSGIVAYCTNISGFSTTLTAGGNYAPGTTYLWSPGGATTPTIAVSPPAPTAYYVAINNGSCTAYNSVTVVPRHDCCGTPTSVTSFSMINTSIIPSATLSGLFAVNQDLYISGNVSLNGEFYMAPNVSIYILPGAYLNTKANFGNGNDFYNSKVHMLSCGHMWEGIQVQDQAKVEFEVNDLIEDAKNAITSNGSSNQSFTTANFDVILNNVVFNRNNNAVVIKNYAQSFSNASPYQISGCVFTCRTLSFTSLQNSTVVPTWPNVSTLFPPASITGLASPWNLQNFPVANLKTNTVGLGFSYSGVTIENCGATSNPLANSPTYYSIIIGDRNASGFMNLFDNLFYGIYAINSNIASFSNIFQNTRAKTFWGFGSTPGSGIFCINNNANSNAINSAVNLVAPANSALLCNRFFQCHTGVSLHNIYEYDGRFAEFRSTQNSGFISAGNPGNIGIQVTGNRFKNYRIENCKFLNVQCGVKLNVINGNLNLPGAPQVGQFWGKFSITTNYFSSAAAPTATQGSGFMRMAVDAQNVISSAASTHTISDFGLRIMYNTMDRVWNGILVNNYTTPKMRVFSANNRILLSPLTGAGLFSGAQNGIKHLASYGSVINSNTITAFTVDTTFKINGVYSSMNTKTSVQCNSVVTIPRAFNFYSLNATTWWLFYRMNFNGIGLQLTYTATIGQQGGSFNPSDNIWEGSWAGRNGTWTYSSTAVSSKIFQRGSGFYLPPNNDGVPTQFSYLAPNALNNTGGTPSNYSCAGNMPGGGGSPIASREIIDVAADTIPPQTDPDEIEQFLVYMSLKADSLLLASNDTLQGFVDTYEQENLGILSEIERLSAEGDYTSAGQLLSNFIPETNIQNTYKSFYDLYISVKLNDDSITEVQLSQLQTLALQCPFADGEAVYKARAFYALLSNESLTYNDDNCTMFGFSRSSIPDTNSTLIGKLVIEESKKIERAANKQFRIYPNPGADFVFVSSSTGFNSSTFILRDVSGRVLKTVPIPNGVNRFKINFDLENGIYFGTVIEDAGGANTKRFVIQK